MTKATTRWNVHADHQSAVAAARDLAPALRERAAEAEAQRTISERTIDDLRSNGLFHLCSPRSFGGSQLGISTFVETTAEVVDYFILRFMRVAPGPEARYMLIAPHVVLAPGLAMLAVVLSINLLGDRLRDRLDVRNRQP